MSDTTQPRAPEPALWLVFTRGARGFAIAATEVRFVIPTPRLSEFPTAFDRMLGVFAHRGRIYPLLDANESDAPPPHHSSPIAIVTSGEMGDIAWVADRVEGFEASLPASIERVQPSVLAQRAREAMRRTMRFP